MKKKNKDYFHDGNPSDENENINLNHENGENAIETDNLAEENSSEQSEDESALEALEEKYNALNDKYLRLHADFDNFRKRTLKEKAELIKSGGEKALSEILPLIDDFERALDTLHKAEDKDAMQEGMELIYNKFIKYLEQHGVHEIEVMGKTFDVETMEAITTVPVSDSSQKDTVIDCTQKGYTLNDKVIRFPKVIVGQ